MGIRKAMHEDISNVGLPSEKEDTGKTYLEESIALVEKWSKTPGMDGKGLYENFAKFPKKIANTVQLLERQEKYLARMNETQVSSAFNTLPQNIMRVIRLGYPNSVRGEIFHEFAMQSLHDSFYYIEPVYGTTLRDATADATTYESASFTYDTTKNSTALGTGDASTVTFTATPASGAVPIVSAKSLVRVDGVLKAVDDGSNGWTTFVAGEVTAGTITYTTGAVSITFATAPATGAVLTLETNYDAEDSDLYAQYGSIKLKTTRKDFKPTPKILKLSWSWQSEVMMDMDLDLNAEEVLVQSAAEEFKKCIDFEACLLGYKTSLDKTAINFNADFRSSGAANPFDYYNTFYRSLRKVSSQIYKALQRGGVNRIYGGPDAVGFLASIGGWIDAPNVAQIGAFQAGTLRNIPVYQVPISIVPNAELVCVYKNPQNDSDVAIAFGTAVPLYRTTTLQYANLYSETALAILEDAQAVRPEYIRRMTFTNL